MRIISLSLIIFLFFVVMLRTRNRLHPLSSKRKNHEDRKPIYVDKVAYGGGFVWFYLPDFSCQWGEFEARRSMMWIEPPIPIKDFHH